jgi:hypothetical protein
MVLISVDNVWKYEYGSDLAIFPAVVMFPSNTLLYFTRVDLLHPKFPEKSCSFLIVRHNSSKAVGLHWCKQILVFVFIVSFEY